MVYEYDFPLPTCKCSPNYKSKYTIVQSTAKGAYKNECIVACRQGQIKELLPRNTKQKAHLFLGFCTAKRGSLDDRYRPLDPDNAIGSAKMLIDALVICKALRGDRFSDLKISCDEIEGDIPCIHIVITIEEEACPTIEYMI